MLKLIANGGYVLQLIPILLFISAFLSLFSGVVAVIGSRKDARWRIACFCIAMVSMAFWTLAVFVDSFGLMGLEKVNDITTIAVYITEAIMTVMLVIMIDWRQITKKSRIAKGWRTVLIGLILSLLAGGIFCLLLPQLGVFERWGAPLISTASVFIYYYAILRYRVLDVSNSVLKIWSRVILAIAAIMSYIVLFFFVAKYIFHTVPDNETLALNLVMIILVVILFPILNDIYTGIKALISTREINMVYVTKKLNRMATQNVKMDDLAEFLADYLHFQTVAFIVKGKIYSSDSVKLKSDQIAAISMLDDSEKSIWQEISGRAKDVLDEYNIKAVASLRNAKGRPFGQILIGKPLGKMELEKRDLAEIETVINIVASMIDSTERVKA